MLPAIRRRTRLRALFALTTWDTSDGDYEWAFKSNKSDENHTKAKSAVQASKSEIVKLLDSWIDEFKNL